MTMAMPVNEKKWFCFECMEKKYPVAMATGTQCAECAAKKSEFSSSKVPESAAKSAEKPGTASPLTGLTGSLGIPTSLGNIEIPITLLALLLRQVGGSIVVNNTDLEYEKQSNTSIQSHLRLDPPGLILRLVEKDDEASI